MKRRASEGYAELDPAFEDFAHFIEVMGPRPTGDASIDRIDNQAGYAPGNCRWSSKKEQSRNRRNTVYLEYRGERLPLTEWAEKLGIAASILRARKAKGMTDCDVIEGAKNVSTFDRMQPDLKRQFELHFGRFGIKRHYEKIRYVVDRTLASKLEIESLLEEAWYPDPGDPPPSLREKQKSDLWKYELQIVTELNDSATRELARLDYERKPMTVRVTKKANEDWNDESLD